MFRFRFYWKTSLSVFFQTKTIKNKSISSCYFNFLSNNTSNLNQNIFKSFSSQQQGPVDTQSSPLLEELRKIYTEYTSKKDKAVMTQVNQEEIMYVIYNLATISYHKQEFTEAEKLYKECLEIAHKNNIKNINWMESINSLGTLLGLQGKHDEAMSYLLQGKEVMEASDFKNMNHILERSMLTRSLVHEKLGQQDIAKELLTKLLQMNENSPVESLKKFVILPYKELGHIYLEEKNISKAIEIWEQGINFVTKHYGKEVPGMGELYGDISDAYMKIQTGDDLAKFGKSADYYKKYFYEREKEGKVDMFDNYELARRISLSGDVEGALGYARKFLDLAKDRSDLKGNKVDAIVLVALANYKLNNQEEAIAQFNEAVTLAKSINGPNSNEVILVYIQWFQTIREVKIIDEHLEEMMKIADACKGKNDIDENSYVHFLYWIANSLTFKKDWMSAVKYSEECLNANAEKILSNYYLEGIYKFLAIMYANHKIFDPALVFAQKGKKIVQELNGPKESLDNYDYIINGIEKARKNS